MPLNASAPGSLMLLGEYAVLHGKPALVCAIDKRITVTLTPRGDDHIHIQSESQGTYATSLSQLTIEKPFHFVLGALKHYQAKLKYGCDIAITSEFSDHVGLGSSAAVTVATLAALMTWLKIRMSPLDLVRQGRYVVRQVQGGLGSGADVAASVYGGMVAYQTQPLSAEKCSVICPLTALYAGFKTPTIDAIRRVQQRFASHPALLQHLHHSIGQCALDGLHAVRKQAWTRLGDIMNIQQGLMEALGVSSTLLSHLVETLRQQSGIWGAKISGAGLGDCVIGIGALSTPYVYTGEQAGVKAIPVAMSMQGVKCEKG